MKYLYLVDWDNGHSSGIFPDVHTSRSAAVAWARSWKANMVSLDEDPKEARSAYTWEIRRCPLFVKFDCGVFVLYDTDKPPRCAVRKETSWRYLILEAADWLRSEVTRPGGSKYIRNHTLSI